MCAQHKPKNSFKSQSPFIFLYAFGDRFNFLFHGNLFFRNSLLVSRFACFWLCVPATMFIAFMCSVGDFGCCRCGSYRSSKLEFLCSQKRNEKKNFEDRSHFKIHFS